MDRNYIFVFVAFMMLTGAAHAQMSEKWLKQEDSIRPIAKKACKDQKAFKQLKDLAWTGDPTASYWVYRTMTNKRCVHYTRTRRLWDSYLRKSAEARFPRAMREYGKNLMYGYGLRRDVNQGVSYLERAVSAGNAGAAGELAYAYGKANVLPYKPRLALQYLDRAVKAGLNDADIRVIRRSVRRELRREVEKTAIAARKAAGKAAPVLEKPAKTAKNSGATQQTANNNASSATTRSPQEPKYAVLAVSKPDAAFGWAYDFKNRDQAQRRALSECRKRNGKDCDVKLILRGGGCIAYRYKQGQSVYGWGVSRQRSPAQNRAADECRKRNANQECNAHAWACNSTTKAKLVVELEKDMPPLSNKSASTAGKSQCLVLLNLRCKAFVPGKAKHTYITGASRQMYRIENCAGDGRQALGWSVKKNQWHKTDKKNIYGGTGFSSEERAYFKPVLMDFKKTAVSKFPGCKAPEFISINFYRSQSGYDIFAKAEYWKKVIPYTVP